MIALPIMPVTNVFYTATGSDWDGQVNKLPFQHRRVNAVRASFLMLAGGYSQRGHLSIYAFPTRARKIHINNAKTPWVWHSEPAPKVTKTRANSQTQPSDVVGNAHVCDKTVLTKEIRFT